MLARLGLLLALVSGPVPASSTFQAEALVAPALRVKLRLATSDIAKTGDAELVERMRAILAELGDSQDELTRSAEEWERLLLKPRPQRSVRTAAANRLRRELAPLLAELAQLSGPRRTALARCLNALDSEEPSVNAVLGRERDPDGVWRNDEERVWKRGAEAASNRANGASGLAVDVEHGTSTNPALVHLMGGGRFVRAHGVELHGRLSPESLERILRQSLRAAALSRGLLFGHIDLPQKFPRRAFLLLDEAELLPLALEEARAARGLNEAEYRQVVELDLRSFHDSRGWSAARYRSEADFEALMLWDLAREWLGADAQPCLRVGHVNWICLRFLGTSAPLIAWSETSVEGIAAAKRSSARAEDPRRRQALWRCARTSLWGSRAWMIGEVRAGRAPPWARAMLDQDGKIRDANLLKTTLVCELLQQEGRLWELFENTRERREPTTIFEKALGESLPNLEQRWQRWLDPERRTGIVQELLGPAPVPEGEDPFAAALLLLNQSRADALAGQGPEIPVVAADAELARAAEAHARYLAQNPEQKTSWPQMHEEYADKPGYSVEGALAASRSLVAFSADPRRAVEDWLATFYHRLPLLEPGLFGVGFGKSGEIVVLDSGSLVLAPWKDHVVVWPLPQAEKVPLRFTPELPNPVPGADMGACGYPVSVQLIFQEPTRRVALTLELFHGTAESGTVVECHFVSPDAPLEPELVPPNAWGLIPKAALSPKTRYTARARWNGTEKVWSFTTGN
jgi:hypothetical protein